MKPILTRCGYRCDLCLAYKANVENNPSNQQKLSDGWYKYFGFRLPPEKIICDGCMSNNPKLIDQACLVKHFLIICANAKPVFHPFCISNDKQQAQH
ncbi:MAG: hypothetical protein CVU41_16830 [Chloroflexi bacterium HGW-Chloroflexi-3]|nr:MAG: hypothetical protein CVU41_16830 [Chloroflexi bacterium HGW-Chloroflexi-3]